MCTNSLKSEKQTESLLEMKEILAGNVPFSDPQFSVARWAAEINYSGSYLREVRGALLPGNT